MALNHAERVNGRKVDKRYLRERLQAAKAKWPEVSPDSLRAPVSVAEIEALLSELDFLISREAALSETIVVERERRTPE
jgi:hypothetical protein